MSDPSDLHAFWNEAWQHIGRGVADARAPCRYPTFATVAPDGTPEARTVAMRAASQSGAWVEAHTDNKTPKIAALQNNPVAALHFWVPRSNLQIRLTAQVALLTGEDVDDDWARIPAASRVSYGTQPAPGTPIPSVFAYEKPANRERFMVLRCQLTKVDLVHLGRQHRRAIYVSNDDWQGTWVAP